MATSPKSLVRHSLIVPTALVVALLFLAPMTARSQEAQRPRPTVADFAYDTDSERQKFDFWQAASDVPTPVVLLIHGGGWAQGDKTLYGSETIQPLLDAGVSVAAVNYRFILQAMEQGVEPPVKACLHDAARALQTIRSKAGEWNIDPSRVGATGSSAGACTSLWLALHDDLADPKSSDPVARESSRITCAVVVSAKTSLDPQQVREWMPNAIYGGHAFGYAAPGRLRAEEFELLLPNRDKVIPWIKEYSPIELVSSEDPPVFLEYPKQQIPPQSGKLEADPTHSVIYGLKLAETMSDAGVEAVVSYPANRDQSYGSVQAFLLAKLATNHPPTGFHQSV